MCMANGMERKRERTNRQRERFPLKPKTTWFKCDTFWKFTFINLASVAQIVVVLPCMQETQVQSGLKIFQTWEKWPTQYFYLRPYWQEPRVIVQRSLQRAGTLTETKYCLHQLKKPLLYERKYLVTSTETETNNNSMTLTDWIVQEHITFKDFLGENNFLVQSCLISGFP